MKPFDERLVGPTPEEVAQALLRAMRTANRRLRERRIDRRLAFWRRVVQRTRRPREGVREWTAGRGGRPAAQVVLVWWADHVGRRHYRVMGQRAPWPHPQGIAPPLSAYPLWRLYPDNVALRQQEGREELVAVCACGACGRPADIGWTGERCGPCHDRLEEGMTPPVGLMMTLGKDVSHLGDFAFTQDGRLVTHEGRAVTVRELAQGTVEEVLQEALTWVTPVLAVSPDDTVAYLVGVGKVRLHDLTTGEEATIEVGNVHLPCLAFSPDGRWLAMSGHGVFLLDRHAPDSAPRVLLGSNQFYARIAWAPDGRTLYATDATLAILRVDVEGGEPVAVLEGTAVPPGQGEYDDEHPFVGSTLACSADGQWLARGLCLFAPTQLDLCHLPTGEWSVLPLPGRFDAPGSLTFSPDSRFVVVAGINFAVRFFSLPTQREFGCLRGGSLHGFFNLGFSPDGQLLATGTHSGGIKLYPWRRLLGLA